MNAFLNDAAIAINRSRVTEFVSLTKPELTFLSVLTALGGAYLGLDDIGSGTIILIHVLVGTLLLGGGAGVLNQYIERHYDARMKRTENRPIPSGKISAAEALWFGSILSASGLGYLLVTTNLLTSILAVVTLFSYLFLYTPLKRITWLSTIVGGIPGALPPVMGWTAVRNEISVVAVLLFAVLFFWQMPHFFSLAWMYRIDYKVGGFKMLSVLDKTGKRTAFHIVVHTIALLVASVALGLVAGLGYVYLVGAALIGLLFIVLGVRSVTSCSNRTARRVFFGSLAYLPLLLALVVIDKL